MVKLRAKSIKLGDVVKLRKDVLVRHARSVPAHAGYTREQFKWRETLGKLEGKQGIVTRTFASGNVNVQFADTLIGISGSEIVKIKSVKKVVKKG